MANSPNVGNQIDAVAKKKYVLDLPAWVCVAVIVAANVVGVIFRI